MPHHTPLIALLVGGFVLAFVFGMIARRLRLSPLLGYLIAGILVGPHTPGFVGDQKLSVELAEIGVILLMFGVGLHFSLRDLMSVRAIAVPGAIVQIAVATLLGWLLARWLGWSNMAGLVFGLALSVASTVVLLRSLDERRLLDTERGRIAVGWLIVEDIAMVLALVLLPALAEAAAGSGTSAGDVAVALGTTFAKVGAFVAFMLLVGRRVIPWTLTRVVRTGSRELFTLCVLSIAMGVAFGSAYLFGVSFALGAFFAGMVLNESEFSHEAANETLPLREAFAVLFFVSVGMLFDPAILMERPLEVLATASIIIVGKSVAAYAIVRAFRRDNDTALLISVSLAQIGEFSFILAALGLQLQVLPQDGSDLILAGALLSIVANPLLFAWLDRRREKQAERKARQDARDAAAEPAPVPDDVRDHALVIGYGRVGRAVVDLLAQRGVTAVVIDDDDDRVRGLREGGRLAVRGNAVDERVLLEAAADRARIALLVVPNALEGGEIVSRLRALAPAVTVLARAHSDEGVRHLLDRGADAAVMAERELAHSLVEMVLATPAYRGQRHLPPATV
ncbi:Kef family K(+) transporter [Tolypothrix campylonemoides VB511288]|nr:Kef family K(+) transporter [Tolypothrix campylonemoides VB511288]